MRGLCSWSMSIVLIQLITAGFRAFEDQFEHLRVILLGFVIVVVTPPNTQKKRNFTFQYGPFAACLNTFHVFVWLGEFFLLILELFSCPVLD